MLHTIKLSLRSLKRNRLFSFVNLLGLTIGFFTSILIYIYVESEVNYDQHLNNVDRIYRINQTFIWGEDNPNLFAKTGPAVAFAIKEDIPEVEQVVRVFPGNDLLPITFAHEGKSQFYKDERIFMVDSSFFNVFSFELAKGNPKTALVHPRSVVLTSTTAKKYFGESDPLGRLLMMDGGESFKVTGVLNSSSENSYLDNYDLLVSLNSIERVASQNDNWMWTMFETFILVNESADESTLAAKINQLPEKYLTETLGWMGYTYDEYIAAGKKWDLYLQPYLDIRLHSANIYSSIGKVGDIKIVGALIGSAIFLLILSCINYINLSTAQFTSRAKDVALRKILGGTKVAFISRFFGEALLFCIIAATVAAFAIQYVLPLVNQSLGTELSITTLNHPLTIAFILGLILCLSSISGFYPFVFFNAFKPVSAMKGEMKSGVKGMRLRNGMLVTQYTLSFILIIGTLTIYRQIDHFMNVDVGFEKENLLSIENVNWMESPGKFADELSKLNGIEGTSVCDALPLFVSNGDQFQPEGPDQGSIPLNYALGDDNYIDLLGLEMIVGRNFDLSFGTDSSAVILNETAAKTIGWSIDESILNKKIENWSGKYHVIGVVRDFNFWSLHAPIEPFAIFSDVSNAQGGEPLARVMVRVKSTEADFKRIEKEIEKVWGEFVPNRPYESNLLTTVFESQYQTQERFGSVLSFFAVLTIIIASLGLFGIVVFSIEQKIKEIGVRKVLGASMSSLIMLFSKTYVKLLLVAFIIALPLGYYFMDKWLSDFEYRVDIGPSIYVPALLILLVISLSISTFHTVRASLLNPADVLKDE